MNITIQKKVKSKDIDISIMNILRIISPLSSLRKKELEVLSHLIPLYRKYKDMGSTERALLALSYENKIKVCEETDIKPAQLDNVLTTLRKKGILKGRDIQSKFLYDINKDNTIIFKLSVEDE